MKKIPTMFERDWDGNRRVVDKTTPGCEWVTAGEGVATQKLDGTCCMVRDGILYKRRELRNGEVVPAKFIVVDYDHETDIEIGWVPVGDGPEDRWHREGFANAPNGVHPDGTYELLGPKVQGNPEGFHIHALVPHDKITEFPDTPRTFNGLLVWLMGRDIEGIVFHHPDGRMAKVKLKDFGLKRKKKEMVAQ